MHICCCLLLACFSLAHGQDAGGGGGFLDWVGRNLFGLQPAYQPPPQARFETSDIGAIASQGFGLLNFFGSVQRNPIEKESSSAQSKNEIVNLLGIPGVKGVPDLPGLPNIGGLQGVPVVPGLAGSFPGAGACLPKGTPLINPASPSFIQNFLRQVPGAQDLLKSLLKVPPIDLDRLMGKWYWVLSTPSVHGRYCATSEYSGVTNVTGTTGSFGVFEKFKDGAPHGPPKIGFGYGVKLNKEISVYSQSDPCPYQIVGTGPIGSDGGQYEYLILSNWAKYPVIGLAKDLSSFQQTHRAKMEEFLRSEGYTNFLTDAFGTVAFSDWAYCRDPAEKSANIAVDIVNGILFGKRR